jgi:hypothetical protein
MGFAISWLAFHGRSKEQILDAVQFQETGEPDEANESPQSGATFPQGWYVIFLNKFDHPLVSAESLSRLSQNCKIIAGQVEEHVMYSSCCEYSSGNRNWSISHDAQEDLFNLEVDGQPPDWFAEIKTEMLNRQDAENRENAEVDFIFDIPVLVGEKACGHRHDRWKYDWGEPAFTELRGTKPRSILARLLRPSR